ncbi:MAG: hypothetical protein ABI855_18295, partial [Bacteroidota bacterium]
MKLLSLNTMKKIITVVLVLSIVSISHAQSPNSWHQKQNCIAGIRDAVGFNISSSGYYGTGLNNNNGLWEYNSITDSWAQKASLPNGRDESVGFSIGKKGYIGTGIINVGPGAILNDFWEYDPATNIWIQKANFGGGPRWAASGFSIGNKGYIGTGDSTGSLLTDFWEYDPIADAWTQKSNLNMAMDFASGFSIGNKGYMGAEGGFYEYDPSVNTWTQKASYPDLAKYQAPGFCIGGKGYIGTGENGTSPFFYNDFWEYDPTVNSWTQRSSFPGTPRRSAIGFCIGTKGYIGTGFDTSGSFELDFWEYTPICTTPVTSIYSSGNISFCNGDSVFLCANTGYNYQWKKNGVDITGAVSYFHYAKTTGSYTCYLSNSCGAVTSSVISVTINTLPSATITSGFTTFCSGGSVTLNAPAGTNKTYQ